MKRSPRLLFLAASILLTLACLGESETTKPIASTSVTHTPTETAAPTATPYTPNLGITVAYILDGNIWLWDESAPTRQLTSDGDARRVKLSDDGKVIVYQRTHWSQGEAVPAEELGDSLWAVNADGSSPRLLVNISQYATAHTLAKQTDYFFTNLDDFQFQPNSHWVYFSTTWDTGTTRMPSNELHRIDADNPNPEPLLADRGGEFTFSPDGRLMSLSSLAEINIINADASNFITALSYQPLLFHQRIYSPQVVWLSDSTGFYTIIPSAEKSRFMYVSADGSISAQLAEFSSAWVDMDNPVISPDGTKVAYVIKKATSFELHVVDAATIDTTIASYEGAPFLELLGWSPDSKRVIHWNSYPGFPLIAGIGIPSSFLTESVSPYSLRWIDAEHFIFFREGKLLIGQIENPDIITVASGFQKQAENTNSYDFIVSPVP